MKNLLLLGLMFFGITGYGQGTHFFEKEMEEAEKYGTTQMEYNYLSKGVKIQEESGLDMKKGYRFSKTYTQNLRNNRSVELRALYRIDDDARPCGYLFITMRNGSGTWFCIPSNGASQEIKDIAYRRLYDAGVDKTDYLMGALQIIGQIMDGK